MPAGIKPDTCIGKKGRSGRKTKAEEIEIIKEQIEENITQEMLIKLANSKVYGALTGASKLEDIKSLGLPITLKGMTEKSESTINLPQPILYGISGHDSHKQDNADVQEDKSGAGGDISQ